MWFHRSSFVVLGLALTFVAAGCGAQSGVGGTVGTGGPTDTGGTGGAVDLGALYRAAVEDAEVAEANEVYGKLDAIDRSNSYLQFDAAGRVLMVTWTSWAGYDANVGKTIALGTEVWMTPGRRMQDFCKATGLSDAPLSLRLKQLLGLPADSNKDRVIELWVTPANLFRPSPDPEINDSVAELDFPPGTPQAHIDWITKLKESSYGMRGYPWTRLGYTYDWSPGAQSEVGLSEFVAPKGSTVVVESVTPTDTYCQ